MTYADAVKRIDPQAPAAKGRRTQPPAAPRLARDAIVWASSVFSSAKVTDVFTDGSCIDGVAAFAVVFPRTPSRDFACSFLGSPLEAELRACVYALQRTVGPVRIFTDCWVVYNRAMGWAGPLDRRASWDESWQTSNILFNLATARGLDLSWVIVKGHTRRCSYAAYWNDAADRAARGEVFKRRKSRAFTYFY